MDSYKERKEQNMAEQKSAGKTAAAKTAKAVKSTAKSKASAASKAAKSSNEFNMPSLEDLLNAGAHFGHRKSRWDPKMNKYIYTVRNGVHIIDLVQTMKMLKSAVNAIQTAVDHKSILIVGTKGQAAGLVKKVAEEHGAFYVNQRWPGGLITNFDIVKKSITRLIRMEEKLASGAEDLVKKERLMLKRDVERLNRMYEGVKFMDRLPGMIIVIDSKLEKNAIAEARNAGIPIVALLDTNCDPEGIDYPIPANDDSIKSIKLFVNMFEQAIAGGKRANSLRSLRNSHEAKLAQLKAEFEERVAREKQQEEEAIERLKRMRAGLTASKDKSSAVRVVKKVDSTKVESKVEEKPADKKVEVKKAEPKAEKTAKSTKAKKTTAKKATTKKAPKAKSTAKKIADLDLGTRTENALEEAGVKTVTALSKMSDEDLEAVNGVGPAAVKKIKKALK